MKIKTFIIFIITKNYYMNKLFMSFFIINNIVMSIISNYINFII